MYQGASGGRRQIGELGIAAALQISSLNTSFPPSFCFRISTNEVLRQEEYAESSVSWRNSQNVGASYVVTSYRSLSVTSWHWFLGYKSTSSNSKTLPCLAKIFQICVVHASRLWWALTSPYQKKGLFCWRTFFFFFLLHLSNKYLQVLSLNRLEFGAVFWLD